jgi:hypothetical protein
MKTCTKCKIEKPLDKFGKKTSLAGGLCHQCKDCVNAAARARDGRVFFEKPLVVLSGKTKTCFKCGETKPLERFHKHHMMADGRLNKCATCATADSKKWKASADPNYRKERYLSLFKLMMINQRTYEIISQLLLRSNLIN